VSVWLADAAALARRAMDWHAANPSPPDWCSWAWVRGVSVHRTARPMAGPSSAG